MPEINGLNAIDVADVSDDDLLAIYDSSAPSSNAKKVTRANFLKDVVRDDGDHNLGTVEIDDLTATAGTVVDLTVTNGITFDTAALLEKMFWFTGSVVTAGTAAGASETINVTVTGVLGGDCIQCTFANAIGAGLISQAWVSSAGTVSIKFYNTTASPIAGTTYVAYIAAFRVS